MSDFGDEKWDETIVVGDLVLAYHKGIHQVIEIERRFLNASDLTYGSYKGKKVGDEYTPLLHYKKIATPDFKRCKTQTENSCDAYYCKKIDAKYFKEQQQELKARITELTGLMKEFCSAKRPNAKREKVAK